MRTKVFFLILFVLISCDKKKLDNPRHTLVEVETDKLSLVFSHNINGETHPCGCRHFPLGGLPQVAGQLSELKKTGEVILTDTGDLLFPSSKLPPTMRDSFTFGAENLAKGMSQMGLRFFVLGDQDLALGIEFLKKIQKDSSFDFLVSNLKNKEELPHKELALLQRGDHKVFLLGIVDPSVLRPDMASKFENPEAALKRMFGEVKKLGFDKKNKKHRLVLLSHSGMANDQNLVKKYPDFDWVLGAHTQNFTKIPYQEGKTKLAQVLSRNHYLGEVSFDLKNGKDSDAWTLHEIRDELKDKLKPNPFSAFIEEHKEKIKKVQMKEQGTLALHSKGNVQKINTANSCIECHQPQVDFWSGTAHSVAYATLINANEDRNLNCIGCHSVGYGKVDGFSFPSELVHFEKETYEIEKTDKMKFSEKDKLEKEKLESLKKQYWGDISQAFKGIESIRALPEKKIRVLSNKWLKQDEKYQVTHNFSNVQCLNCHSELDKEHPFAIPHEISKQAKHQRMKENCLNCHDPDQSPEWYEVLENGKPGRAKDELVNEKIKSVACPLRS